MINKRFFCAAIDLKGRLINEILPRVLDEGFHPKNRMPFQYITGSNKEKEASEVNTTLIARQLFVISYCKVKGWIEDNDELIECLWNLLVKSSKNHHTGGYAHKLTYNVEISDSKEDLYDHAFILLGLVWASKTGVIENPYGPIKKLLEYINTNFQSAHGGWKEGNYTTDFGRQNPHMHLFEACLNGQEIFKDQIWADTTDAIFKHFTGKMFDLEEPHLMEYYSLSWGKIQDESKEYLEPGHLLEWVWLLCKYNELTNTNVNEYITPIYHAAYNHGFSTRTGLMYGKISKNLTPIDKGKRFWPMLETIKANIAMAKSGGYPYQNRAANAAEKVLELFVKSDNSGEYIDRIDEMGRIANSDVRASTLYHLVVAVGEASDFINCAGGSQTKLTKSSEFSITTQF